MEWTDKTPPTSYPLFRKKDCAIVAKILKRNFKVLYVSREGSKKYIGYDIRSVDPSISCAEVITYKRPGYEEIVVDILYHKDTPIYNDGINFEFGGF